MSDISVPLLAGVLDMGLDPRSFLATEWESFEQGLIDTALFLADDPGRLSMRADKLREQAELLVTYPNANPMRRQLEQVEATWQAEVCDDPTLLARLLPFVADAEVRRAIERPGDYVLEIYATNIIQIAPGLLDALRCSVPALERMEADHPTDSAEEAAWDAANPGRRAWLDAVYDLRASVEELCRW